MNLAGKRLVVVGGGGLIGSHVVEQLLLLETDPVREIVVLDNLVRGKRENLPDDPRVVFIEGTMEDQGVVRYALSGADGVFLLASLWLDQCAEDPAAAWRTNVMGSLNVVDGCIAANARLVYSSSASVYGNAQTTPITEDHPLGNRTTYGATKIAVEQMLRAAAQERGLRYLALRYMNVYGPKMDNRGAYVSVIMRTIERVLRGERPVIHGGGKQVFDFVYVEDVARANVAAMKCEHAEDAAINIGTGIGTDVSLLVQEILTVMESPLRPVYEPGPKWTVTSRIGSTELAERLLGFKAAVALRNGIERTVRWRSASA